jgi:hypothetical protein
MSLRRLLNIVFAVFVTVGLALSPLATTPASAHSQAAGMDDMSMSGGMPCCPDREKSKDCQDCPLVAICVLKTVEAGPSTAQAVLLRYAIRTMYAVQDDVVADGLDRPPPDQPPRTLA